jgi:hypothetical protein
MNKPHPHAALMAEYAKDAAETDKPWERWEFRENVPDGWFDFAGDHPGWLVDCEYRRKPLTIRIGEYDVPEPLRDEPEDGEVYWVVDFSSTDTVSDIYTWSGDFIDRFWFNGGLIHTTEEAAQLHAKALISLTQTKE